MQVVNPAAMEGETKLIAPITMENIADSVLEEGLASAEEIEQIIAELYRFGRDSTTVASLPRVVQSWGYRPPCVTSRPAARRGDKGGNA